MSTIRIDSAVLGKSGKSFTISMGDQKFYAKPEQGLQSHVGKTIEAEVKPSSFPGKDGNTVTLNWIETYRLIGSAPAGSEAAQPSTDRWFMPFVSNTVAHAIAAGLIKQPSDIAVWAMWARDAAVKL